VRRDQRCPHEQQDGRRGPTLTFNPTISQHVIDAAYEDDPAAAAAEYGAEFRRDVEAYLPPEALDAVRMIGRFEQPYQAAHRARYVAFLDPAGGTGIDSFTLAIAHHDRGRAVLDLVREVRPPFSPEATVAEFAGAIKAYGLAKATSDRYAGSWPVEAFRKQGVTVEPSTRTKSEIYQDCLPLIMSGTCELLDHARLLKQLAGLERRTARGGKDSIDHAPRLHDDVANAAAGALVLAGQRKRVQSATWGRDGDQHEAPAAPLPDRDAWLKAHDIATWRTVHANEPAEIARRSRLATGVMLQMLGRRSPLE
jgi:hypothetical protein